MVSCGSTKQHASPAIGLREVERSRLLVSKGTGNWFLDLGREPLSRHTSQSAADCTDD